MSRTPKNIRPGEGYAGRGRVLGDPPASELYPLRRGGQATPDRSRDPEIGPACATTGAQARPGKRFASTDELRSGVDTGGNRGNVEGEQKTAQEYGNAVTERRGQRTMPPRPGQWG